jgi:two-component system sensor histidine kinase/response regulator
VLVSKKPAKPGLIQCGYDRILRKPLLRDELLEGIEQCLSKASKPARPRHTENNADSQSANLGLRVLVAEDNRVNQLVAAKHLSDLGCSFSIAEDGSAAVAMSDEQSFDVILMDMRMPEMNGDMATLKIRERETASGERPTPIIALTANAFESDEMRCREVGMNGFLSKPYTSQQLRNELSRHVSVARAIVA